MTLVARWGPPSALSPLRLLSSLGPLSPASPASPVSSGSAASARWNSSVESMKCIIEMSLFVHGQAPSAARPSEMRRQAGWSKSPPALPLADSLGKPEALSSDLPSTKRHPSAFPSSLSSPDPTDHSIPRITRITGMARVYHHDAFTLQAVSTKSSEREHYCASSGPITFWNDEQANGWQVVTWLGTLKSRLAGWWPPNPCKSAPAHRPRWRSPGVDYPQLLANCPPTAQKDEV
jgi:hypothetical protein